MAGANDYGRVDLEKSGPESAARLAPAFAVALFPSLTADCGGRCSILGIAGCHTGSTPFSAGSGKGVQGWQQGNGATWPKSGTAAMHSVPLIPSSIWKRSLLCSRLAT